MAAIALVYLLWRLYRWERRDLSRPKRGLLVGLRVLVLLAVAVDAARAGVGLVASARRVPSHLAIVLDDSESMRFSDPYTDDSRAVALAADMKLESDGRRVARRAAAGDAAAGPGQEVLRRTWNARRGRELYVYDLESAAKAGSANAAQARKLDDIKPKRPISPLGDALQGVLASHRGQPVAGIVLATDGRSNTGEDPLRAAEAAIRQNIPIYAIAAGADEGPRNIRLAEIEVSPVVFVRDPMTLGVVVEARGLQGRRGDRRPGTADQRRRLGAGRQPAGRPGRGRDPQADDVPHHAQGGRPVRVPRTGRGRRAGADAGRQRRDRRGAGRPPADPRAADRRARRRRRSSSSATP